ncbi:MAG TPA: PEP/pyruvate-binding domain-containing protein [Candidatus Polarisedimenticolaceae bacterium]|nr:PEP/pyruvate-binding domain-containing protein [Candidatus Polarisedimenticolaceae bacterium]
MIPKDVRPDTEATLREALSLWPELAERIARQLLIVLHSEGLISIDAVYGEARAEAGEGAAAPADDNPNRPGAAPWSAGERVAVRDTVLQHAAALLTPERVQQVVDGVRRRDEAESLETIANLPGVSFEVLAEALRRFCRLPRGDERLAPARTTQLRVALIRNFISDQLEFIGVAKNYLRVTDFEWILDRIIGSSKGQGRIGGKAAGLYLGYRILQGEREEHGRDPIAQVHLPESWFVRSDLIETVIRMNRLDEWQSQKYKPTEEIRNEYPLIRQIFQNAEFPEELVQRLDRVLETVGHHPLIVRSSSLLEDRFGAAFSGMYASVFLGNQGTRTERLKALLAAVAEVFASTLAPNPLSYRRRHNLIDYNEDMAILIQKVVGRPHGRYFFPDVAGVGFSRNEYRWSPRLKSEDGLARVVYGLGTRAVDRTGNDYSRLVALGAPMLRPEVTPERQARYAQRMVDVIDLAADRFTTVPLTSVLEEGAEPPGLDQVASIRTEDGLVEPTGSLAGTPASRICLTFDRLLARTRFAAIMRDRMRRLEDAYGTPVNVEFAQVEDRFYLLQCRPLVQVAEEEARLPRGIPRERVVFSSRGLVRSGEVPRIDTVVYVDPRAYDAAGFEKRAAIGRAVARVNDALEGRTFLLMGPGRWGTNDPQLGVRVHYADINHCAVLIEIAHRKGEYVPEVSYGTHFFQDLVEDGIYYLALHPDEGADTLRESFFLDAPNALASVSPQDADLARGLHVVHTADAAPGRVLRLAMDGEAGEAMCWLE